jgi:hypothetical protein
VKARVDFALRRFDERQDQFAEGDMIELIRIHAIVRTARALVFISRAA